MTDLQARLDDAKDRLDRAARDCLLNRPGAAQEADAALAEVLAIQAMMRADNPALAAR
jgi:hypothetical protein